MTVQSGLVPLLDEQTGRFPDEFAPLSVAADATAAHDAAEAAQDALTTIRGLTTFIYDGGGRYYPSLPMSHVGDGRYIVQIGEPS